MPSESRSSLLETALAAARAGGDETLPHFQRAGLRVEWKADRTPVTEADRAAEVAIRRVIQARHPHHTILGEEFATANNERPAADTEDTPQWIIDPIDGTASFIRGVPLYGVLIGVVIRAQPVIGVMRFPALDETVYAALGSGAWHIRADAPPSPARVSEAPSLADAICCTTSDDYFRQTGTRPVWDAVRDACASTRGWSDSYAFMLLATGRIDAVVEPPVLHPWDAAGAIPIIQEAGGRWTDWTGACSHTRPSVLATNARLHAPLLQIIGDAAHSSERRPRKHQ